MRSLLLVVLSASLLTACGGGDDDAGGSGSGDGPQGGAAVAESLDCAGWVDDTEELYVAEGGRCDGPDGPMVVNWFDSTDERDSWIETAEQFGDLNGLQQGDQWVAYAP